MNKKKTKLKILKILISIYTLQKNGTVDDTY